MAEYRYTANGVWREKDALWIPADPLNRDYRKFLAYKDAGGLVDPYIPPPVKSGSEIAKESIENSVALRNLIRALAKELGKTEKDLVDAIQAEAQAEESM